MCMDLQTLNLTIPLSPLDLLTVSASTTSCSNKPQALTAHSPERYFHFSVLNRYPTSFLEHPQCQYFIGSG